MDISELCNVLLKNEIDSRKIPANEVIPHFTAGAKVLTKNGLEVFKVVTTAPFNAPVAMILLIKVVYEIQGEIKADAKLNKLIGGFYEDGLKHLTQAGYAYSDETRKDELKEASSKFITAANTASSSLIKARAMFFAGVCYELRKEEAIASNSYKGAYEAGQQEVIKRLERLAVTRAAARTGIGVLGGALGGGAGMLALIGIVAGGPPVWFGASAAAVQVAKTKEFQRKVATALTQLENKTSELTGEAVDFLRAKEIQEIHEFQGNFLVPLSELLSRDGRKLISQ